MELEMEFGSFDGEDDGEHRCVGFGEPSKYLQRKKHFLTEPLDRA